MTKEYVAWLRMNQRCNCPGHDSYPHYGGRGIAICERWRTFENFLEDMGPKPSPKHSLDRRDVNGNYEPGNCRWATSAEQARNKRTTKLEPHEPAQIRWLLSEGVKTADVARFYGIGAMTVGKIKRGERWV